MAPVDEVVRELTRSEAAPERLVELITGLVPVDPIDRDIVARAVEMRRLRPLLRSPQEGLLYFLLECHRPTRGRFEANRRIRGADGLSYEVDLLARRAKLVVEIDGLQHEHQPQAERDAKKEAALRGVGYEVFRLSAGTVVASPVDARRDVERALALRESLSL